MPRARLRVSLLIAGLGAVLVLVDLFGTASAFTGAGLMALGALLSAPAAPAPGRGEVNWWALLAAGAALALIGVPLGLALETPGGLLAGLGGVLVVISVALGLP
ncbi:MAG: hypothetical protein ACXWZM_02880 [Solirubrobacterales bacterium]